MTEEVKSYLEFQDWISTREHLDQEWITVARFDDISDNYFTIFSALINASEDLGRILADAEWEITTDLGKPYFSQSLDTNEVHFHLGDREVLNGITFEPFVILRDFHGAFPSRVDVVQNFVLYHGLYYDNEKDVYIHPLKEEVVVKYLTQRHIQIRATYLKDYLAARQMILVRFHDHRRQVREVVTQLFDKEREEITVTEKDRNLRIVITQSVFRDSRTVSVLLGKDVIRPFAEPKHEDYLFLTGKAKEKFVKFLINIDEQGNEVEETCNEDELSNNFVNRRKPHFLTPVFFKREVLQKYYQNPRKYTVGSRSVRCLDLWVLVFDINSEGLVVVWLGDLGRIPYEEQLHWRQFNIPPRGEISEAFYKTQLLGQFAEVEDPVSKLMRLYEETNSKFQKKYGFKLFRELNASERYIYKSIHEPTTPEQRELDEQLIYLSKLFIDSIDKSQLSASVTWRPHNQQDNTNLKFFESFLVEKLDFQPSLAQQIVTTFGNIQRLRSKSAAHIKSKEFVKELQKLGLADASSGEIFKKLVGLLIGALTIVRLALE